jgi:type 1 glutamine amidotransferase
MLRLKSIVALAVGLSAVSVAQSLVPQASARKIQVLIVTGRSTHEWRATTPVLREMLEETGRFEVRVTEEPRGAGPETLAPYDVVILNYLDREPAERWGDRAEMALADFVRSGKGLVVFHVALAAFAGWPEFEAICGGNLRPGYGHHSPPHEFTVKITDPDHPITRGLTTSFAEPTDDLYANLKFRPEGSYHVLATAWDDHSRYSPDVKQPTPGPGLDRPVAWTVEYGRGRVFAITLGHGPVAMSGAGFQTLLTRGTEWASTGAVTIPVPERMKPAPSTGE